MAYTQTDVDNIKAAIVTITTRGAAEVEINGRRVKYSDPLKLQTLLEVIQAQVSSNLYGGSMEIEFKEVTN